MSKLLDYYGRLSMRVMMHHSDITVTSNCTLGKTQVLQVFITAGTQVKPGFLTGFL